MNEKSFSVLVLCRVGAKPAEEQPCPFCLPQLLCCALGRYNLFTGCPKAKTCTIILRGGAEQFMEETERSLHDAIMIVRRAIKVRSPGVPTWAGTGSGAAVTPSAAFSHPPAPAEVSPAEPRSSSL